MALGVKHYFRNGTVYTGKFHKMPNGQLHTGVKHTPSSKRLFHFKDLSEKVKSSIQKKKD